MSSPGVEHDLTGQGDKVYHDYDQDKIAYTKMKNKSMSDKTKMMSMMYDSLGHWNKTVSSSPTFDVTLKLVTKTRWRRN